MKEYAGVFAEQLSDFVAMKQAMGFKYTAESDLLRRFSQLTVTPGVIKPILTKEIVEAWSMQRPSEGLKTNAHRVSALRQFAIYLTTLGMDAYVSPHDGHRRHRTFVPYILTHDEIDRIFTWSG